MKSYVQFVQTYVREIGEIGPKKLGDPTARPSPNLWLQPRAHLNVRCAKTPRRLTALLCGSRVVVLSVRRWACAWYLLPRFAPERRRPVRRRYVCIHARDRRLAEKAMVRQTNYGSAVGPNAIHET